jgi:hypothetical protein
MISSVMRSVPLRIASVATAARSILSSPIVPSERVRSFRGQGGTALQIRWIFQRDDFLE